MIDQLEQEQRTRGLIKILGGENDDQNRVYLENLKINHEAEIRKKFPRAIQQVIPYGYICKYQTIEGEKIGFMRMWVHVNGSFQEDFQEKLYPNIEEWKKANIK